jgi:hypothetical protein
MFKRFTRTTDSRGLRESNTSLAKASQEREGSSTFYGDLKRDKEEPMRVTQ